MFLDLCASHGLSIMNAVFEHKVIYKCTRYQTNLDQRLSYEFVVVSLDLQPYVLDTQVGGELDQMPEEATRQI